MRGWFARDVNGDGNRDIFVVDQLGNRVVLYAGDGRGNFGTGVAVSTGRNHGDAAFADFDRDGYTDVVLAQPDASRLQTLRGTPMGLVAGGTVAQGSTPRWLASIDYDHDGDMDLVVWLPGSSCIDVRTNGGAFDFATAACVLSVPTPPYQVPMATVHWNGDGFLDLVALPSTPGPAVVYRSTGTGFVEQTRLGSDSYWVQAIDVNRDGAIDLALFDTVNGRARAYTLGTGAAACASMIPPMGYTYPGIDFLADFNGDGWVGWIDRDRPASGPVRVYPSR